jgi:ubiquinone/menaquinone biosynthesis C-methylase UbiE
MKGMDKNSIRNFWNMRPCGTQFTESRFEWGSREFFEDVEKTRRETQPFMTSIIRFDQYKGKKLLEIGCGLGTDLTDFAKAGAEVTAIDLTRNGVELTKKHLALHGLSGKVVQGDAENLVFPDNSFDVVYSFGVLHHTPDTQRALDEVLRILKPGGEAIIMLYHTNSLHVRLGTLL